MKVFREVRMVATVRQDRFESRGRGPHPGAGLRRYEDPYYEERRGGVLPRGDSSVGLGLSHAPVIGAVIASSSCSSSAWSSSISRAVIKRPQRHDPAQAQPTTVSGPRLGRGDPPPTQVPTRAAAEPTATSNAPAQARSSYREAGARSHHRQQFTAIPANGAVFDANQDVCRIQSLQRDTLPSHPVAILPDLQGAGGRPFSLAASSAARARIENEPLRTDRRRLSLQ